MNALTKLSKMMIENLSDARQTLISETNQNNPAVELMAVVFSLHPDVKTTVYPITSSPVSEQVQLASTPLPESDIPAHMTDKHWLLKQCQKLLYMVYYREMGWRPNSKAHTQFDIRKEEKLFCDRYDETAIWTVVLDPARSEVAACTRILSAKLSPKGFNEAQPDLDILGYSGCSESFRDWVQAKGAHRVLEGQRFAIAAKYRRLCLAYHLFHVSTLAYMGDSKSPMYDPEAVYIIAAPVHMRKYLTAAGGIHDKTKNWTVLYEKRDPMGQVPIYTVVSGAVNPSIQAFFKARIEKQRGGAGHWQRESTNGADGAMTVYRMVAIAMLLVSWVPVLL